MKTDEERIFRVHRKRLAREAEALVAEQASLETGREPWPLHLGDNRDTIPSNPYQGVSMVRERGHTFFENIERLWYTKPDRDAGLAGKEGMSMQSEKDYTSNLKFNPNLYKSFIHTNPDPTTDPPVAPSGLKQSSVSGDSNSDATEPEQ